MYLDVCIYYNVHYSHSWSTIQHSAYTNKKYIGKKGGKMLKSKRKTALILVFETSKFGQRHVNTFSSLVSFEILFTNKWRTGSGAPITFPVEEPFPVITWFRFFLFVFMCSRGIKNFLSSGWSPLRGFKRFVQIHSPSYNYTTSTHN